MAIHSSISCSPFYLNYGIYPSIIPLESLANNNPAVTELIEIPQKSTCFPRNIILSHNFSMAQQADKHITDHPVKDRDRVYLFIRSLFLEDGSRTRKLQPKFCGPLPIETFIIDVAVKLEISAPMKAKWICDIFHASLLKPYSEDSFQKDPKPLCPVKFADGHEEYEVDQILADRISYGKTHFLVQWKNDLFMKTPGSRKKT